MTLRKKAYLVLGLQFLVGVVGILGASSNIFALEIISFIFLIGMTISYLVNKRIKQAGTMLVALVLPFFYFFGKGVGEMGRFDVIVMLMGIALISQVVPLFYRILMSDVGKETGSKLGQR